MLHTAVVMPISKRLVSVPVTEVSKQWKPEQVKIFNTIIVDNKFVRVGDYCSVVHIGTFWN